MPLEVSVRKYLIKPIEGNTPSDDWAMLADPVEVEVYQSLELARVAEACGIQNMNDMSLKEIWIRIHHLYDYYATLMPNFHKHYKTMESLERMQDINFKTNVSKIDSKTFVMRMAAYATQSLVTSLQDAEIDIDYNYVMNCKESDDWTVRVIKNKIHPKVKLTSEQYEEWVSSYSFEKAFGYGEPPLHIGDMFVGDDE